MINNSVNKESIYLIISTYHSSKSKNALQFAVYLLHALVPLHVEVGIYNYGRYVDLYTVF